MLPLINDNRFSQSTSMTNANNIMAFGKSLHSDINGTTTPPTNLSQQEQQFLSHKVIENFVESVREMNDVVLIPSKLKDLDPSVPLNSSKLFGLNSGTKSITLNDSLYSYYQMINVVKNDLFEPDFDAKKMTFLLPKRKTSRQHRRESQQHQTHPQLQQPLNGNNGNGGGLSNSRSVSSSSLSSLWNNNGNGFYPNNGNISPVSSTVSDSSSGILMNDINATSGDGNQLENGSTISLIPPLSSEQLIGQSAKQLTVKFIHHLHSLYTILEHFTHAADYITERYNDEVE